jgi:hypothetical protein
MIKEERTRRQDKEEQPLFQFPVVSHRNSNHKAHQTYRSSLCCKSPLRKLETVMEMHGTFEERDSIH